MHKKFNQTFKKNAKFEDVSHDVSKPGQRKPWIIETTWECTSNNMHDTSVRPFMQMRYAN
jgi:hypothetical protein